jgi:hypothetical protein
VSVGADRVWCWVAYRITAAVDVSLRSGYAALEAEQRLARAVGEQAEYVGHLLGLPESTVVALRLVHRLPGQLEAYLVARVEAATHPQALAAARSAATTLGAVPDHVRLVPLGDPTEVAAVLAPFTPAAGGIAQIHKRIRIARPSRPDARVASYVAVEPFGRRPARWDGLLDALRLHPTPLALSVELMAGQVPPQVRRMLEVEATRYSRLAKPVEHASDVGGTLSLGADAGAMTIEPFYLDALRRYDARAFRFAVTLAAPDPLPDALTALLGATVSPPAQAVPNRDDPMTVPSGHLVARPATQAEHDAVAAAFTTLQPTVWGAADLATMLRADPQPSSRDALRLLRLLVDRDEATSLFRLPLALEGHVPGIAVVRPRDLTRVVARPTGPALLLGDQGDADSSVSIAVADLPRHGFIVGTPGSGKTNTALHLCRQLHSHGVPFAVVEPVNAQLNDYRWLATLPEFDDLLVFTVGDDEVAPFRLNPFQVPDGATVSSHVSNLLACFEAAFGLWDPLPFLYRRALVETYRRRGLHASHRAGPGDGDRWPVLTEFAAALAEVVENLGYAGEVHANIDAAARLRAEALVEGACGTTLNCRRSYDIGALMRRPVVFELAGVGDNAKEQSLITLLLITAMRGWYRQNRRGTDTPHVLLLEEAHRVFPRATPQTGSGDAKEGNAQALAAERIAQGLAEDRKYGQSYVLIDQQVGKVAEDAYKITNLKVMHRTAAEDDRRLLGQTMSLTPDQERTAAGLKPFEALVSHNTLEQAVQVTVPNVRADDARTRGLADAPLAEDYELATRFSRWRAEAPSVGEALAPFAECAPCRHRCAFRRHAESVVDDTVVSGLFDDAGFDSDDWWNTLPGVLSSLAGDPPQTLPGTDHSGWTADYRTCVFLHAQRRHFPPEGWSEAGRRSAVAWVRNVREALSSVDTDAEGRDD